jgi:hypothetical protein
MINPSTSVSPLFRRCGILNISQPWRPPRPVKAIALLFHVFTDSYYTFIKIISFWIKCVMCCCRRFIEIAALVFLMQCRLAKTMPIKFSRYATSKRVSFHNIILPHFIFNSQVVNNIFLAYIYMNFLRCWNCCPNSICILEYLVW